MEKTNALDTRQFIVTIRQLSVFSLWVSASDEEEAADVAYEMEWPDPASTITEQECTVEESQPNSIFEDVPKSLKQRVKRALGSGTYTVHDLPGFVAVVVDSASFLNTVHWMLLHLNELGVAKQYRAWRTVKHNSICC